MTDAAPETDTADHADVVRVARWSRLSLDLDDRQLAAVDRALEVGSELAANGDAESIKAVGDALRLDGFDEYLTAEGFLRLVVLAARTGSQLYGNGIRTWWEYRSPEEVGSPPSIASWGIKPLPDDHPPVLITPENYAQYSKGSCGQDAVLTPPQPDGEQYIELTILVGDMGLLAKIRGGKVELSAGYTAVMVDEPGVDPSGVEYRFRQTEIVINHLAVVDAGRAGPLARINIDGGAWEQDAALTGDQTDMSTTHKDIDEPAQESVRALMAAAHMLGAQLVEGYEPDFVAKAVEALSGAVVAAMVTGEIGEETIASLAAALELEPEAIAALMTPGEPAPAPETTPPENEQMPTPEEQDVTVELTDKITAKMSKADAAAWQAHTAAQVEADAAAAAKVVTDAAAGDALGQTVADQAGKILGLTHTVNKLQSASDLVTRDALVKEIASACPDIGKKWTEDIAKGSHDLDATDMMVAAIVDLDPACKADIDIERGTGEDRPQYFDGFVRSLYRTTTTAAGRRRDTVAIDPNDPTVSADHNDVISLAAYGNSR